LDRPARHALVAAALLLAGALAQAHGDGQRARAAAAPQQQDWGIAADAATAGRTIEVRMLDTMRFEPAAIRVRQGETVRFVVRNAGKLRHEFVIGTQSALEGHAALMEKFPEMEHDEPWMAHVAPGRDGRLAWTFNRAGEFGFACLIAGHYQAGMTGRISVEGVKP
jgi:uncharacterized cupredoxin-like copper-binding protein